MVETCIDARSNANRGSTSRGNANRGSTSRGAPELEELPLRVAVDEDRDEAVVIAILLVAVLKVVGSL